MNEKVPQRRPMGGIGYANQQAQPSLMQQILAGTSPGANGILGMSPELLQNAPPWAAAILVQVQNLVVEVEILKCVLLRRHIITEPEIMEATMVVNQKLNAVMKETAAAVEREVIQQVQPQTDPRRSPS